MTYSVSAENSFRQNTGNYRNSNPHNLSERKFSGEEYYANGPQVLKNIVLVGTKLDLVSKSKREVTFKEAVDFANRLGLAGAVETSAKGENDQEYYQKDIDDCFFMCACSCIDKTRRELEKEMAM